MNLDYVDSVPEIEDVLLRHFPNLDQAEIESRAESIRQRASFEKAFEKLDHSNTDPKKDQANIASAAQHLEKAANLLGPVGWYGQKTLTGPLELLMTEHEKHFGTSLTSNDELKKRLCERLSLIAERMKLAADKVEVHKLSLNTAFGDGPEFESFNNSKPKKLFAKYIAIDCANNFYEITGAKPTVSTNPSSAEAYGPFLDYVADIFRALKVNASAESQARKAVKEFSPEEPD